MRRIAWLTDQHGIFVDPVAWELALQLTNLYQPTDVPVGSDDIDFYTLSFFSKNPQRKERVQDELDDYYARAAELKDAVDPYWRSIQKPAGYRPVNHPTVGGNHNRRFFRQLWENPKFFGLEALEYANLMKYDRFGYTWLGDPWDFKSNLDWSPSPGLVFSHGSRVARAPGASVQREMAQRYYDASLIVGHCHRGAMTSITRPDGVTLFGVEGFCLCQLETEYAKLTNWTQGITFVTVCDSGALDITPIPFTRHHGRLYAYWREQEYSLTLSRSFTGVTRNARRSTG